KESIDIIKAKELINIEELSAQLAAIKANFTAVVAAIAALEERLPLCESLGIVEKVRGELKTFASKLYQ
ncbi:Hypothetical protein FKW44_022546, partial [Caligus rogercresseyi]